MVKMHEGRTDDTHEYELYMIFWWPLNVNGNEVGNICAALAEDEKMFFARLRVTLQLRVEIEEV